MSSSDIKEILRPSILKLIDESKTNSSAFDYLMNVLIDLDCDTDLLESISVLCLASTVPELKEAIFMKLVELLRLSKMNDLRAICDQIMYCKFILKITSQAYFPEMIKTVQNILILFSKNNNNDKLFLPLYKLQRLKDKRNFLHFSSNYSPDFIEFNFETFFLFDFDNVEEEKLKSSLLNAILDLIAQLKDRYKQLEAFESIFYFIDKLLDQLISDYPEFEKKLRKIRQISQEIAPKLKHLVLPKQKPQILPMLEPDYSDRNKLTNQELEQNMRKKLKRESKSVQRELKKDSAFINSVKLEEQLERDRIRKEKVKRLIAEIQQERSMFKK